MQLDNGGTIRDIGTVNVTGVLSWSGGTIADAGTTNILPEATLNITASGTVNIQSNRVINNNGTINWTGSGGLAFWGGSTLNNSGGIINILSDSSMSIAEGTGYVNNAGTMRKSAGSGTTLINSVAFSNTGTLDVQSGRLDFNNSAFQQSSGTTNMGGGTSRRRMQRSTSPEAA